MVTRTVTDEQAALTGEVRSLEEDVHLVWLRQGSYLPPVVQFEASEPMLRLLARLLEPWREARVDLAADAPQEANLEQDVRQSRDLCSWLSTLDAGASVAIPHPSRGGGEFGVRAGLLRALVGRGVRAAEDTGPSSPSRLSEEAARWAQELREFLPTWIGGAVFLTGRDRAAPVFGLNHALLSALVEAALAPVEASDPGPTALGADGRCAKAEAAAERERDSIVDFLNRLAEEAADEKLAHDRRHHAVLIDARQHHGEFDPYSRRPPRAAPLTRAEDFENFTELPKPIGGFPAQIDAARARDKALAHAVALGVSRGWGDQQVVEAAMCFASYLGRGEGGGVQALRLAGARVEEREAILAMLSEWESVKPPTAICTGDEERVRLDTLRGVIQSIRSGAHHRRHQAMQGPGTGE